MSKSQKFADFEQIVERIIFKNAELETLKIAIKNFTEGITSAKELKGLLLQCRGRMVKEISDFAFFIVDTQTKEQIQTDKNKEQLPSSTKVESQLRKEIEEKKELLETVAKRVNQLVFKLNNEESTEDQKLVLQIK